MLNTLIVPTRVVEVPRARIFGRKVYVEIGIAEPETIAVQVGKIASEILAKVHDKNMKETMPKITNVEVVK